MDGSGMTSNTVGIRIAMDADVDEIASDISGIRAR